MAEKIETTRTTVVYKGACPVCGSSQVSPNKQLADAICMDCQMLKAFEAVKGRYEWLIGAEVIDFGGGAGSAGDFIDHLTIKTPRGIFTVECRIDALRQPLDLNKER